MSYVICFEYGDAVLYIKNQLDRCLGAPHIDNAHQFENIHDAFNTVNELIFEDAEVIRSAYLWYDTAEIISYDQSYRLDISYIFDTYAIIEMMFEKHLKFIMDNEITTETGMSIRNIIKERISEYKPKYIWMHNENEDDIRIMLSSIVSFKEGYSFINEEDYGILKLYNGLDVKEIIYDIKGIIYDHVQK